MVGEFEFANHYVRTYVRTYVIDSGRRIRISRPGHAGDEGRRPTSVEFSEKKNTWEFQKMTKILIALLALDIGVSLSKIYIFTWQENFLA